ncbi:MAG: DUF2029 domain-containing protein [Mycobacteriaceae bacterium]|nr:DUF2029 domain-containing protein [Mycobacteriaceae bacterium]
MVLYLLAYLHWPNLRLQIDAMVYRFAGDRLLGGLDLYSVGVTGKPTELLFIYPPFAAICAAPLALLQPSSVQILWLLGVVAALAYVVVRMLKSLGMTPGAGLWSLATLLFGVIAWLEPMRLTAQLGQINLLLLVLVVADLLGADQAIPELGNAKQGKWTGVGIGVAAGLKLTPALFIVYLLLTRRVRAALVAAATFAATIAVGFAVAPADSRTYWLAGRFDDVNRISRDLFANTSVRGLFLRLHWPPTLAAVVAIAIAVVALAVAAGAYRRGHAVLAIAIVGMASTAASPFSWSHHWVWFAPLVVHLGYRGYVLGSRYCAAAMWFVGAFAGGWFVSVADHTPQAGILSLRPGGIWNVIMPAAYVFLFAAVLLCTAAWLSRTRDANRLPGAAAHDLHDVERAHA